ncbi:MAG TPA: asparagine synthase (glutamine-hydrolyzing) [Candidatus Sulfotelmatobacter sp.]|nr:asparagine synthase (glutamine-hydrolyzing) [Candidatus Sulfotelmatobacter sp.]
MCGLAGFAGTGDRDDLSAMTASLAHRGPDGQGLFIDPDFPVYLGHRRLAIVDVEGGAQPMGDSLGRITVVFNGEIYNHAELRRQLEAKGHRFQTNHSDTEVLIHGWKEWGENLVEKLNGMFAFALWDRDKRSLFLARDRFGEKPLFWARTAGGILFASELSALAGHRAFTPEIDRTALKKLLAHGFIPSPNAFWKGARKLPGGTWLLFSLTDGSLREGRFWTFSIDPDLSPSDDEAAETVRHLLRQSVERRLMSDVPLGVFLSGGVDSSAVAAFAAQLRGGRSVQTFSIGFTEESYDESPYARAMAEALGTDHHQDILTMDGAAGLIPTVLQALDEPMGDPSILPTYLLCRFARTRVTVALSGDGGDELFAGYDTFAALRMARLYRGMVPAVMHRGMMRLAELLPKSGRNMSFDYKLRRALGGMGHDAALWHPLWLAPLSPPALAELLDEPVHVDDLYAEVRTAWNSSTQKSLADRSLEFYTRFYLQDDILTKVDRAAMMNGLEARSVFLDNDLVDYVRRLPAHFKIRGGVRKFILKKALEGVVPSDILNRKKKGFGIPLMDWMRRQSDATFTPLPGSQDGTARRWLAEHRAGKADHRLFLWNWTVLSQHRKRWFEAS